ncbi:hypothetical protein [Burkholderia multivorans]|uniref:hypothetical protein n=1 Tax=Burkholderia multivorans TaxID=87883 RepID=UPI001F1F62CC|nr:hypothetical protein [Burkholderia multivorans]
MNTMRAALAAIPAEPWDALTAERRIADHAPTPAGAARREPLCETSPADAPTRRRAYSPTHRRPTKSPSTSPPPSRRPATAPAIRARK